jgi:hypothetical protein
MLGFGNNKQAEEEKAKQEQIAQAMKAMSDQIAKQAQTIKSLEDQLAASKGNAAISSATTEVLAAAQAQIKQMHDEMEKLKASSAAAPAAGKSSAAPAPHGGSGAIGSIGGAKVGPDTHADAPPAAVPAPAAPAPAATGGLSLGATAYVQKAGGKNLRLHDKAGLEGHVSDSLHPGTQLTLLIGPVEKDGYPWWRIRTTDGREGWVAGTELLTHPE